MFDSVNTIVGIAVGVSLLVGTGVTFVKWVRPGWRRHKAERRAEHDAIVGRAPVVDTVTGRELAPALPGIGVRMDTVERHLATMADALRSLADDRARLAAIEAEQADHHRRIQNLESNALERAAGRYEAAETWKAVGKLTEARSVDEALDDL